MALLEKELIIMAQKGNSEAFEELIYKYDKGVLSLALRYINDTDHAKDIYQEVFIRVYKGLKNFRFESEFSTWLFRIATNVCITHKEKKKSKTFVSIDNEYQDSEPVFQLPAEGAESSPEESASESELKHSLDLALKTLSEKQKMAFVLKNYEGYKIKEIAEIMDCKEGTVKKYIFEAVHKLRDKLKHFSI